ncbi:uncharacterized protein LOC143230845 isoform X3 [Tachypleus tridentatus]|uniref:uncharacterized protein LOC143230845 isoform X3 n=1 Tax=Tachypleus tridentatus TaxID=6853 RepID=UPI003FD28E90
MVKAEEVLKINKVGQRYFYVMFDTVVITPIHILGTNLALLIKLHLAGALTEILFWRAWTS